MMSVRTCRHCGNSFDVERGRGGPGRPQLCSTTCALLEKVEVRASDECWLWSGSVDSTGYGQFTFMCRNHKPHRVALALKVGRPLVPAECCMHACDTPLCCNPAHLSIGTRGENILDAHRKGRLVRPPVTKRGGGSLHFDDSEIVAMRNRRANGETIVGIAQSLGLNRLTVANIVHRKTWKNVA